MTQTSETLATMTADKAIDMLVEGNKRFVETKQESRELLAQVEATATGQFPFAAIVSCIDSRVPVETVFDQGVGDVFCARVAGNVINEDILASLEYACGVVGSKLVLVLGHTKCGAVKAACDQVELGHITQLLDKIQPAIAEVKAKNESCEDLAHEATIENVALGVQSIRAKSSILKDLEDQGKIKIVGALYDVANGQVSFL